jgi:hypothetical protein
MFAKQTAFIAGGPALAADEPSYVPPKKKNDVGDSFKWSEDVLNGPHFSAASVSQFKHVIITDSSNTASLSDAMDTKDDNFCFITGTFGSNLG